MSIQINIGDHVSPVASFLTVPFGSRDVFRWARTRAKSIARSRASANVFFRTLPSGRSLTQLLNDRSIWINYMASGTTYGAQSIAHPNEIAISAVAVRMGRWTVLGTLIHELAHVNGAPGGASHTAELALVHCGLGRMSEHTSNVDDPNTPYDPTIRG